MNPDDWCPLHGADGDVCDCRVVVPGGCESMHTTSDGETWYCTEDFDHDGDHLARDGGRVTIFERW